MPEVPCPDGLPWCARHVDGPGDGGLHMSARESLPLRQRGNERGSASAYALALAGDVADRTGSAGDVTVSVSAQLWGGREPAFLDADNPPRAEILAMFIERLALATPAQHRKLAAQVRSAAAIAFGAQQAETEEGNPDA